MFVIYINVFHIQETFSSGIWGFSLLFAYQKKLEWTDLQYKEVGKKKKKKKKRLLVSSDHQKGVGWEGGSGRNRLWGAEGTGGKKNLKLYVSLLLSVSFPFTLIQFFFEGVREREWYRRGAVFLKKKVKSARCHFRSGQGWGYYFWGVEILWPWDRLLSEVWDFGYEFGWPFFVETL